MKDKVEKVDVEQMTKNLRVNNAEAFSNYLKDIFTDLYGRVVENKNDPSSIHHFYHKLMKLEETMNTNTAKEMAKYRVQFIRDFAEEFLDEWNGKK